MRNLKKLLAVIVSICVLATFTVPAFAADAAATKTDAQIATDLGVIKGAGTGVTADYLATQPDRLQGAIMFLRLKGLEDTAKAFIGTEGFADEAGLNDTNKAILHYLKANPDLGFGGIGDNKFSPLTKMSAKEYYKVMLVALGYTYDTDFTWANVFSFAASKGLSKLLDNEKFTVNDLAIGTVEALKATVKGGTDTLIAKLVDGGSITSAAAVASTLYIATPKALTFTASSDTLKTAKFAFNKELNSDTVTVDNFNNTNIDSVKLMDDKKTVVVVLKAAKAEQSKTEDFTVKNIKSTDGTTVAETKQTVTFVDTTIPVVTGVTAKNPKTLVIAASEPMNYDKKYNTYLSEIKVDGSAKIGTSTIDYANNTLTIVFSEAMTAGTRKIDISGIKDFANYSAVATSFNVDVVADTTAPKMVSGKMNTTKEVEVAFDEEISDNGTFYVNNVEIPSANAVKQSDNKTFKLTLASDLGIGATVEVNVGYKNQTDVCGNKVADKVTYTFKVADDTALPTVTAAIGTDDKITLTFSKPMYGAGTIKVLKASDSSQIGYYTVSTSTFKSGSNYTVIELPSSSNGLSGTDATAIIVNIKDMKDGTVRQNALAEQNLALTSYDGKKPAVIAYYNSSNNGTASDVTDDYATFFFSEAMDTTTLNNLSNYLMTSGGAIDVALSTVSDVKVKEIASDNKSIKITIPGINNTAAINGTTFKVTAVKDTVGNMADTKSPIYNTLAGSGHGVTTLAVSASGVKAVSKNKIEVLFDAQVGTVDPSTFVVKKGSDVIASFNSVSVDSGLTKVSFTTSYDMGTTFSGLKLAINDANACKDVYGTALTTAGFAGVLDSITDAVKPYASTIEAGTTAGTINIKFSEYVTITPGAIATTTANALLSDVLVRDADGNLVAMSPAGIEFYLDGVYQCTPAAFVAGTTAFNQIVLTGLTSNKNYSIETLGNGAVVDLVNNAQAPVAKTTVTIKQ